MIGHIMRKILSEYDENRHVTTEMGEQNPNIGKNDRLVCPNIIMSHTGEIKMSIMTII